MDTVKSPLNNLRGLISLHDSNALTPAEFKSFIKQIDTDLSYTTSMEENILFWTARQRKGEVSKIEMLDLKQLVEENIEQVQNITKTKSLNIEHNLNQKVAIQSDKGVLNFVVRNLLGNAIKFSHPEGTIHVLFTEHDNHDTLQIIDQGIGMTDRQIQSLFESERAESIQGTKAESGTGIGLNLAKEYLENIGGSLSVQSKAGEGSCFEINLPK